MPQTKRAVYGYDLPSNPKTHYPDGTKIRPTAWETFVGFFYNRESQRPKQIKGPSETEICMTKCLDECCGGGRKSKTPGCFG